MTFKIAGLGVVAWLFIVAGIAKIAEARGRFVILWAIASAAVGAGAFLVGVKLVERTIEDDTLTGGMPMMIALVPPIALLASMGAVAGLLYLLPIKVSSRRIWPVTRMAKLQEAGRLVIGKREIALELPSGTTTLTTDRLRDITADGECVHIRWDDGESMLMPRGKPDTPDGRKQQSRTLESRLRALK
jgi:hypothetical protein